MNTVTLLQPPRVVVGNGCAAQCADWFARRGASRVLLVSSAAVLKGIGPVLESFRRANLEMIPAPLVEREPTVALFESVLAFAQAENVDAVLGIGGGSPMDVAKLVAALCVSPASVVECGSSLPAPGRDCLETRQKAGAVQNLAAQNVRDVFGINLLRSRNLSLACVPTTSGTGSEVSPNAILLDESDSLKKGVVSPYLVPDAAFIDPLLTLSVPPAITAATGLDALTHCIEAYTNKFAHPVVDVFALEGIRLISANLLRAVRDGSDVEARAALSLGSYYGGLCLGPVNTAAVHALSYPLGGSFHIAHGISNAVLLPNVLRFNLPVSSERLADVAAAVGIERNGSSEGSAEHGVERIANLSQACGIPQRLSELGIPRESIPDLARAAMKVTRLLKNNPRPMTEADAVRIYEATF